MNTAMPGRLGGTKRRSSALHIVLWLAQIVLALMFAAAGFPKATAAMSDLATKIPWTTVVPEPLVRFIGIAELFGAVGLILPAATRIRPRLTPLAAAALALVMLLALGFHATRGELVQMAPINLGLGALALFVAWGRYKKAPIEPR